MFEQHQSRSRLTFPLRKAETLDDDDDNDDDDDGGDGEDDGDGDGEA